MMIKLIIGASVILILIVFWFTLGNSHKVEGRLLKVRGGQLKNVIKIDDITSIYDTDVRGPARLNDGKAILYLNTINSINREIVFIKTKTNKNYVLAFSNPDDKEDIFKNLLKINDEIEIIRE